MEACWSWNKRAQLVGGFTTGFRCFYMFFTRFYMVLLPGFTRFYMILLPGFTIGIYIFVFCL